MLSIGTVIIVFVIAIFLVGYISQPFMSKNPPSNLDSERSKGKNRQQAVNRRKRHCPQCGYRLRRDDRFCPQCGHSMKT